jgi:hypothetical protein
LPVKLPVIVGLCSRLVTLCSRLIPNKNVVIIQQVVGVFVRFRPQPPLLTVGAAKTIVVERSNGHQNGHQFSYSVRTSVNRRLLAAYSLTLRNRLHLPSRLREKYEDMLGWHAWSVHIALLKTSTIAVVRLMPEGVSQHLERGFGQQLARFA